MGDCIVIISRLQIHHIGGAGSRPGPAARHDRSGDGEAVLHKSDDLLVLIGGGLNHLGPAFGKVDGAQSVLLLHLQGVRIGHFHLHGRSGLDRLSSRQDPDIKESGETDPEGILFPVFPCFRIGLCIVFLRGSLVFPADRVFCLFQIFSVLFAFREDLPDLQLRISRNSGFRPAGQGDQITHSVTGQDPFCDRRAHDGKDREALRLKGHLLESLAGTLCPGLQDNRLLLLPLKMDCVYFFVPGLLDRLAVIDLHRHRSLRFDRHAVHLDGDVKETHPGDCHICIRFRGSSARIFRGRGSTACIPCCFRAPLVCGRRIVFFFPGIFSGVFPGLSGIGPRAGCAFRFPGLCPIGPCSGFSARFRALRLRTAGLTGSGTSRLTLRDRCLGLVTIGLIAL